MLTKKDNTSHPVSRSSKTTTSGERESWSSDQWSYLHPHIQASFYQNLIPPVDLDDAHILCRCHEQAIADFQMQIEMIELELAMLTDDGDVLPYNESKAQELEERKLKLMTGKRFQTNARNAYWYYLMKAKG